MESIRIECKGSTLLQLGDLEILQGNLKTLDEKNYLKLRENIIRDGYSFPIFFWHSNGVNWILDGTHRKLTLTKMQEEGWHIPPLPCAEIKAKDLPEAKKKLLTCTSSYAKMSVDGLLEFTADIDFDAIKNSLDLEGISETLLNIDPTEDMEPPPEPKKEPKTCPHCGELLK